MRELKSCTTKEIIDELLKRGDVDAYKIPEEKEAYLHIGTAEEIKTGLGFREHMVGSAIVLKVEL